MILMTVIQALMGLANLASFVFFVIVLIKLFKAEGALKGIIGIICSIYTFIWGWMNHKRLKLTKWMWAWTGCILLALVLVGVSFVVVGSMGLSMIDEYARTGETPSIGGFKPPTQRPAGKRVAKKRIKPKAAAGTPSAEKPGATIDFALEMRKVNNLIKLSEKNADAFFNRGWLHEFKGDMQAAENDYSKAIALDKRHVDALYNRGLIFAKQKKYDLAIQDFSQILKIERRAVDALCNRGSAYFKSGKPDLAIQDFNAALKTNPNDADIYYNRAVVHLSKGDKEKATADFQKAAKMGQNEARKYLGMKPIKKVNNNRQASSGGGWRMDLSNVEIPSTTAKGKIHGENFTIDAAKIQSGILTLRQGKDFFPDRSLKIFLFLKKDEDPQGKSFNITKDKGFGSPHIHMSWKVEGKDVPETKIYMKDYAMRLDFGKRQKGGLPGKIYLSLPDDFKSYVAGSFLADTK